MIRVDALSKDHGDVRALVDVTFEASKGEVLGVLGLNGAGKSTLLRILAGELTPSSGSVQVGDLDLRRDARQVRALLGFLPQEGPLYEDMRVRDFLRYVGRLNGVARTDVDRRIDEVAALTHISDHLRRPIRELSMGYKKRVGIAQAVLHDPRVVLLDEPVSSLDPAEIVGMRGLVRSLGGRHTVLVSSHLLHEVHQTCDRLLVLQDGALVWEGTEQDLAETSTGEVRLGLELVGEPEAILAALPAPQPGVEPPRLEAAGESRWRVQLLLPDAEREALVAALVGASVGVRRIAEERSDLEAMFLRMVGADQAAPGGEP